MNGPGSLGFSGKKCRRYRIGSGCLRRLDDFAYSIRQCEEVFADFMGLRLFGEGYLHSFEYLIAPFTGEMRSRDYPDMRTRAEFLERAAIKFSISVPEGYVQNFEDSSEMPDPT